MLLTMTATPPADADWPATDLGYLLHKNPGRAQVFDVPYGRAHVFYPVATAEVCTAALLLEVDPIGLIKIRMEEFGYKAADLAKEYGDKGTVSKVLNYKQALSLTMIRKFSRMLHIPVEALTREYSLQQ